MNVAYNETYAVMRRRVTGAFHTGLPGLVSRGRNGFSWETLYGLVGGRRWVSLVLTLGLICHDYWWSNSKIRQEK